MSALQIFKITTLPATLVGNAIYLVGTAARATEVDIYVTSNDGSAVRKVPNTVDIQNMINSATAALSSLDIVDDIDARDALTPTANKMVLVLDATGDSTVASGSATYVYRASTSQWIKIAEYESMDVTVSWGDIVGRPTSSVAQIDTAVAQAHVHPNKTELDKISEDTSGNFMYNGQYPRARLEAVDW